VTDQDEAHAPTEDAEAAAPPERREEEATENKRCHQMSPKCLPSEARRHIIQENIFQHSYEELATLCHCHKRTIVRTINEWRQEGGFEQLLFDQFIKLYPRVEKAYPDKALDKLVYLIGKSMIHKAEIKTEQFIEEKKEVTFKLEQLPEDERQLLESVARRYIKGDHKAESSTLH